MHWSEIGRWWGSTPEERERCFPCDAILPDYNEAYFRAVTVEAEPARVFPWLCQLRAAPYSYDWIDNFGRRSPRELDPSLLELEAAQRVMSIFELVEFEAPVHISLRLRRPGLFPPLAVSYFLHPGAEGGCRLIVKLVAQFPQDRARLFGRLSRSLFPWLDWIMMRRQLLNLKALAEGRLK